MKASELEERRQAQKESGYIAVDLDGTLAFWEGWVPWDNIGPPIPQMVARIKRWIADGYTVKIFTARLPVDQHDDHLVRCTKTDVVYRRDEMKDVIGSYCMAHVGAWLEAVNVKCSNMIELWDDRAVQVTTNTGQTLAEEHAAELSALKGAP